MKNINIVLVFTILTIQYEQSLAKECPKNYIDRTDWKGFCCEKVTCQPGTYVEKCLTDHEKDICKPCPKSTWMLDVTNSDVPLPCEEYDSCPFGSIRVDYLPDSSGCHLPCMCDTNKNFFGFDSCNCKIFSGKCPTDTVLALNGSCLPKKIANEENDLRPDNPVYIPIEGINNKFETSTKVKENDTPIKRPKSAVGEIEVILESNDTRNNSSAKESKINLEKGGFDWRIVITILAIASIALVIFIRVLYTRRKRRDTHNSETPPSIPDEEMTLVKVRDRLRNDSEISMSTNPLPLPEEEMTLVKFLDRSRNDSGVSVSSYSDNTNLMRDKEQYQFSPRVKQVALVSPVLREHAEQESTTTEPLEETNSGGPCRLVISASTQEHNM
ncbi:Hypothetical predicted protein [Mytilus galloprovincialis]|uniref:TNFR-Cys domain-containing protein n=1 Tax=Mytilus galloprovincialis TaxID=29158 RepID=A0A8B6FCV2_MYTGA|nr:Hypothetical predicted protein [Mytilus galloprovincialis]